MKNRKKFTTIGMLSLAALLVSLVSAGAVSQAASPHQRVIVTFDQEVNEAARADLENRGGQVLKDLPLVNGVVVLVPERAIPALASIAGVKAVEKDARVFALKPPSGCDPWPDCKNGDDGGGDDGGSTQPAETLEWGVDRIDAELAWSTSRGAGVKVAIVDTGIDKDHEDLIANIQGGVNFIAPNSGPPWARVADPDNWNDDNGHGTHVAGIVGAADNEIGVIGVAPQAYLYGVKVLDKNGSGYVSDVIDGIDWAVENGMNVINMSLGSSSDVQALHDAVDAAYASGILVVAAAGNAGDGDDTTNDVSYPAQYDSVVAVAATASDDSTPSWSSEGSEVEVAAPGVDIRSTWNDGLYKEISGTSMASPHAAGAAALILGTTVPTAYDANNNGSWDPAEVRTVLQDTADDLGSAGHDNFYGYGLVDAEESTTGSQTNP